MSQKSLGLLPEKDPLYYYLRDDIFPQLTSKIASPRFHVSQMLSANNSVYLYEEESTRLKVIGKFFITPSDKAKKEGSQAQLEFNNLTLLRSYGLDQYPAYIIKPFGYNLEINDLLIEEYCKGHSLTSIINDAIYSNKTDGLYQKLAALAYFFSVLHQRTIHPSLTVNFDFDCNYYIHLVEQLKKRTGMIKDGGETLLTLCQKWKEQQYMWADRQVLVHGDATPSNFIFGHGLDVAGIDLERMKYADRLFDLGRIVGELHHYFLQGTGSKTHAEPFIGHFLWTYCSYFPHHQSLFKEITARIPFHIGVTLMRIARNSWISPEYGYKLIREAKNNLRSL